MKRKGYIAAAVAALALITVGCENNASDGAAENGSAEGPELTSVNERVSYTYGLEQGQQIKALELNPEIVALAIDDVVNDVEPRLSEQEMQAAVETFQQQYAEKMAAAQAEQEAQQQASAGENKKAGEEFLAANAEKEGVVTLPSGLQYKQIEAGEGDQPEATDTVTVHYRGTLLDGTVFDSSYERGDPISFPLNRVIKGWTEGLQQMREGSKYELYIPPHLAYGPGGSPPNIGPQETLIFEVELLDVVDPEEESSAEQSTEEESATE